METLVYTGSEWVFGFIGGWVYEERGQWLARDFRTRQAARAALKRAKRILASLRHPPLRFCYAWDIVGTRARIPARLQVSGGGCSDGHEWTVFDGSFCHVCAADDEGRSRYNAIVDAADEVAMANQALMCGDGADPEVWAVRDAWYMEVLAAFRALSVPSDRWLEENGKSLPVWRD